MAPLPGSGAHAYADGAALVEAALAQDCDSVHPGYGFLSEDAGFAGACRDADLVFVGPSPEALALFGDKIRSRQRAPASADRSRLFVDRSCRHL